MKLKIWSTNDGRSKYLQARNFWQWSHCNWKIARQVVERYVSERILNTEIFFLGQIYAYLIRKRICNTEIVCAWLIIQRLSRPYSSESELRLPNSSPISWNNELWLRLLHAVVLLQLDCVNYKDHHRTNYIFVMCSNLQVFKWNQGGYGVREITRQVIFRQIPVFTLNKFFLPEPNRKNQHVQVWENLQIGKVWWQLVRNWIMQEVVT